MTAPLCGSVSMPPLAIAATRCSTSSGMLRGVRRRDERVGHRRERDAHAARRRAGDAGERGDRDGLVDERIGNRSSARRATTRKPGSAAITPPKPYSDAVFIDASSAPATAALLPSANRSQHAARRRTRRPSGCRAAARPRPPRSRPPDAILVTIGLQPPSATVMRRAVDPRDQRRSARSWPRRPRPAAATAIHGFGSCLRLRRAPAR